MPERGDAAPMTADAWLVLAQWRGNEDAAFDEASLCILLGWDKPRVRRALFNLNTENGKVYCEADADSAVYLIYGPHVFDAP